MSETSSRDEATNNDEQALLLSPEAVASVNRAIQQVMENPEVIQEEEYAPLRELMIHIRANPERYPLGLDAGLGEHEDEKSEVGEGEQGNSNQDNEDCVCGLKRGSEAHTEELCEELRPFKMALMEREAAIPENVLETAQTFPSPVDIDDDDDDDDDPQTLYMESLFEYADKIFECAQSQGSNQLYEEALKLMFVYIGRDADEMLSAVAGTERVPLLLLKFERYDNLYQWIRFCLREEPLSEDQQRMLLSGQFPFSTDEECCRRNICEDCSDEQLESSNNILPVLVNAWLLKVRVHQADLDALDRLEKKHEVFLGTRFGGRMKRFQASSLVAEFLTGSQEYRESNERKYEQAIHQLTDVVDRRNPSILPALLWPDPLREANEGFLTLLLFFPRCPIEALATLMLYEDVFNETVECRDMLVRRYGGERPRYHYTPFDYTAEEASFQ